MSTTQEYSVGWITAIKCEYVAAQAFLDDRHERPSNLPPQDPNDYAFGKMGSHNVVIAVLPMGEYGTASAANVATVMTQSFPNIRIALMVGIGGGAPSLKHDIRLGDIVIGIPGNGESGVLQYDFGKTIQGKGFQPTAFINQAPVVLRNAVHGLAAQYDIDGHGIHEAVSELLNKKTRLRRAYGRPDLTTDRLYKSDIVHHNNQNTPCAISCGDDPSSLVIRSDRSQREDEPIIHYGLIASANKLMSDAKIRDQFVAHNDVLCFEMEAAGLVNHFPCLVVRGICDYADSHKSKEWQGYAAMVAAAYAKDLLKRLVPNQVEHETKIAVALRAGDHHHHDNSRHEYMHIEFGDHNSGFQVGQNNGSITHGQSQPVWK
jgi:nucleoside phosphorylase